MFLGWCLWLCHECYSAATLHFYWNQDNNVIYSVPDSFSWPQKIHLANKHIAFAKLSQANVRSCIFSIYKSQNTFMTPVCIYYYWVLSNHIKNVMLKFIWPPNHTCRLWPNNEDQRRLRNSVFGCLCRSFFVVFLFSTAVYFIFNSLNSIFYLLKNYVITLRWYICFLLLLI